MSLVPRIILRTALLLVDRHLRMADYCVGMLEHWRARAKHHRDAAVHWTAVAEVALRKAGVDADAEPAAPAEEWIN